MCRRQHCTQQTCQILLHATEVPWRGPRRPSACQTLVGQGRRALPEHCRAGQSFGTLPFFAQKIRAPGWGPLPLRLLRFGKAAGERCPDHAGQGQVLGLCCFLGQKLAIVARALGWPCCLRLPKLSLGVSGRRACELHVAQI